ncbi:hypothetical protein QE152_g4466 [Popillia japonica]|uniref:Uncharacterized protein n=1 Tax=Popillia japonica TaxID=7064 RepID=A0AAW1N084_POPJA
MKKENGSDYKDAVVKTMWNVTAKKARGARNERRQLQRIPEKKRGGETSRCLVQHYQHELNNMGVPTGRVEYNPVFSKTAQVVPKELTDNKWLMRWTLINGLCDCWKNYYQNEVDI